MFKVISWLAAVFLCAGCSSFQRDWRKAARNSAPLGIEGRWEGKWQSDAPGHDGRLRCLLTKLTEGKYEARFHAKYKKVLGFGYTAIFNGHNTNGVFNFAGEADLGKLAGGVYHYQGEISATDFLSTYTSKYDKGTFPLQRPK